MRELPHRCLVWRSHRRPKCGKTLPSPAKASCAHEREYGAGGAATNVGPEYGIIGLVFSNCSFSVGKYAFILLVLSGWMFSPKPGLADWKVHGLRGGSQR